MTGRESLFSCPDDKGVADADALLSMLEVAGAPAGVDAEEWHDRARKLVRSLAGLAGAETVPNTALGGYLRARNWLRQVDNPGVTQEAEMGLEALRQEYETALCDIARLRRGLDSAMRQLARAE